VFVAVKTQLNADIVPDEELFAAGISPAFKIQLYKFTTPLEEFIMP
jgi:hypothetical protein